jgi:hypothetical protein
MVHAVYHHSLESDIVVRHLTVLRDCTRASPLRRSRTSSVAAVGSPVKGHGVTLVSRLGEGNSARRHTSFFASSIPLIPVPPLSLISSRTGIIAAFLHVSFRSDPDNPSVLRASSSKSKSGDSEACESISRRIFSRCAWLGSRIANRFGILRRIAGSMLFINETGLAFDHNAKIQK